MDSKASFTPCRECSDRNGSPANHPDDRCLQPKGRGRAVFMCKVIWTSLDIIRQIHRLGMAPAKGIIIDAFMKAIQDKPPEANRDEHAGDPEGSWNKMMQLAERESIQVLPCDNPTCVFRMEERGGPPARFGDLRNGESKCNAYVAFNWLCQKASGNINVGQVAALEAVADDLIREEAWDARQQL